MARRGEGAKVGASAEERVDPREHLDDADYEKFIAIRKLLRAVTSDFERMSLSLRKDIENRYYDTILADDVSGRLVGRFLYRLMRRDGEGDGYAPGLFFYAGGQDGDAKRRVDADIEKLEPMLGERVLLATELINAGGSIRLAREALEARKHNVGIASLAVIGREGIRNARGGGLRKPRIYTGGVDGETLHMSDGTGVRKDYEQDGLVVVRNNDESAAFVAAVRREIQDLADAVFDKYFDPAGPQYRGY